MTEAVHWVPDAGEDGRTVLKATAGGRGLTVKDVGCGQWWWVTRGEGLHVDGVAPSESEACKAAFDAAVEVGDEAA